MAKERIKVTAEMLERILSEAKANGKEPKKEDLAKFKKAHKI